MLARGSSAEQQLHHYHTHGQDPVAVVDFLIAETENLA
jgi:hypothetical protein